MKIMSPAAGGCWFCHRKSNEMLISCEFDCNIHLHCLIEELIKNPGNREARIMAREFRDVLPSDLKPAE